ncbi:MAG: TfoX/Sxy family protein [Thermoanaerobaculia bacterium]
MAYGEGLAERIRRTLQVRDAVVERKMFGGIAFMVAGSMACGVVGRDLMVRVGPERYDRALERPHVRPMDFTGRPLRGMVYVGSEGLVTESSLASWVDAAVEFALSAPRPPARRPAGAKALSPNGTRPRRT